jgi:hypothetical protein
MLDKIIISIGYLIILIILFSVIILIKKQFTKKEACPYCKNTIDLERVKKNQIVNFIPFTNVIRLLCYKCHRSHYRIIK